MLFFHRKHFLILNLWVIGDADKNHFYLTSVKALPQVVRDFPLLVGPSTTLMKKDRGALCLDQPYQKHKLGTVPSFSSAFTVHAWPWSPSKPRVGAEERKKHSQIFLRQQDFVFLDIWVARRQDILPNILQPWDPPCDLRHCRSWGAQRTQVCVSEKETSPIYSFVKESIHTHTHTYTQAHAQTHTCPSLGEQLSSGIKASIWK